MHTKVWKSLILNCKYTELSLLVQDAASPCWRWDLVAPTDTAVSRCGYFEVSARLVGGAAKYVLVSSFSNLIYRIHFYSCGRRNVVTFVLPPLLLNIMVKIETIDLRSLRNTTHLCLYEEGLNVFSAYVSPLPIYQQAYDAWKAAWTHESDLLATKASQANLKQVAHEQQVQYQCWVALRQALRLQATCAVSPHQLEAAQLYEAVSQCVAKKHEAVWRVCEAVAHALLYIAEEPSAALIDALGLREIVRQMEAAHRVVHDALYQKMEQRQAKPVGAGLAARRQTDMAYRHFIEVVRLEMLTQPEDLAACVESWNTTVKHYRTSLHIRQGLALRKRNLQLGSAEPAGSEGEES